MIQIPLYKHTMSQKIADIEHKIATLEKKTIYSYTPKRQTILEHILHLKKEQKKLTTMLAELSSSDQRALEQIKQTWHAVKHEYNTLTLLLEKAETISERQPH